MEILEEKLYNGARALDVGSGSGYLTTCMALMTGPNGLVVGIEHIPELNLFAIENVKKDKPELIEYNRIQFVGNYFKNFLEIYRFISFIRDI